MIHRTKEEIVTHHGIEQDLKVHTISYQAPTEINYTVITVLREKQIVIGELHLDHCEKECSIPNDIVDDHTKGQDSCTTKGG
mmetsp:Transcript_61205/g.68534  ORF Transcript_61205/g.68534 Transcript_61205/m.68534 type:complete len:82 (-) Transcript_61205:2204-2449(-)